MKKAFTLAEVLIVIGLIGLIAALTLPVIIARIEDKVLETQKKKAQTVLANGFRLLMAKEDVNEFGYTQIMSCETKECFKENVHKVFNVIAEVKEDSQLVPQMYKFAGNEESQVWQNNDDIVYAFITTDGMIFGINSLIIGEKSLTLIGDVNGNRNPNRGGKDLCQYIMSNSGVIISQCGVMANYTPPSQVEDTPPIIGDDDDNKEPEIEEDESCQKPPSGWDNCHPLGFLSIFGTGRKTCGLCKRGYKLVPEGTDWAGNTYGYCVPSGCK